MLVIEAPLSIVKDELGRAGRDWGRQADEEAFRCARRLQRLPIKDCIGEDRLDWSHHCYSRLMAGPRLFIGMVCLALLAGDRLPSSQVTANPNARAAQLRARIEATRKLAFKETRLLVKVPAAQELGMISWLAYDSRQKVVWIIQRGSKADPIIAVDMRGNVLHSFGKGLFRVPHSIRLDPDGNVWTVDAGNSRIIEFNPEGKELLHFDVSEPTKISDNCSWGATDIAFAPNGRILISDGYSSDRILEYAAHGELIAEWGKAGSGAGQLHLPHAIIVDKNDIVYVADRENGRIEKFDLAGHYVGEIDGLGRVYSLAFGELGTLWATMAPLNVPPGSPGWILEMDRGSGKILGYVPVTDAPALHCLEMVNGKQPMTDVGNEVLWFK